MSVPPLALTNLPSDFSELFGSRPSEDKPCIRKLLLVTAHSLGGELEQLGKFRNLD